MFSSVSTHPAAEFPWRVHVALEQWASRIDHKASALLTVQGGGLLFAATLPAERWTIWTAIALGFLFVAMAGSAAALFPVLGSPRRHSGEQESHLIYFGHVRGWNADTLAIALERVRTEDELGMLSTQLVRLNRSNWRKFRMLQGSVGLMVLAMSCGVAALIATTAR